MNPFLTHTLVAGLCVASLLAADPDIYRDGATPAETFAIGRMTQAPVLDGTLKDWPADAATFLLGQNTQAGRRFNWEGTSDASGLIRLAWDDDYLYFSAEVCDDKLEQANGGAETWQGDTFELFFNIFPQQQRTDGFWQQAIVPPLQSGQVLKVTGPQKDFEEVEGGVQLRDKGYTLECRIPWKNFPGFSPSWGAALGFQLYLDDRDGKGRKTQLMWYPSAITFSHPTHTNTLLLRDRGDTHAPKVLAGPNTWLVTDPAKMNVSAVTDVAGAKTATVSFIPPFPEGGLPGDSTSFEVASMGDALSVGKGSLPVAGRDGLYTFEVQVADDQGRTLAMNTFQAQLAGTKYQQMRAEDAALKDRVKNLAARAELNPEWVVGVSSWYRRVSSFVFNEARPESVNRTILETILGEYSEIAKALNEVEAGRDPYAGVTGSLVRAYRSPLTNEYRPYAMMVPKDYDSVSEKRMPLIVLLHSIFADERMLSQMAETFKDLGALVYQGAAYRQFDWSGVSAAETWAALAEVEKHYRVDADRVYLVGYHIGGRGTWQLGEAKPDRWAALAPFFSGIDTQPKYPALRLYPQYFREATSLRIPSAPGKDPVSPAPITSPLLRKMVEQDSLVTRLENVAKLPILSAYGEDEPNAAAERIAMQSRLNELGAPLRTRYVPGAMHGTPAEEFRDPNFYRWLLSFQRPAYPNPVKYVVTNLRDHSAWWVGVDQLASPDAVATIDAKVSDRRVEVTTQGASAISLLLDSRLAPKGASLEVKIDGQAVGKVRVEDSGEWRHYFRKKNRWFAGEVPAGQKRPGLSGPIDDFQRDRFIFVYGTGGDEPQKAEQKKLGEKLANWGLGAIFSLRADTEISEADLREAHLILIGTPATNSLIAKMEKKLPLRWTGGGLQLGDSTVEGPGAGASLILPNPLSLDRYVVIVTATDEAGYQVWSARNPGGDYVLGKVGDVEGKPRFIPTNRGWFSNQWQWTKDLSFSAEN